MPIRTCRPTTPSRRFTTILRFDDLTDVRPLKRLATGKRRSGGRNNVGRIAVRHRGGGHKRLLRSVDFKRDKEGVPGKVATIEYDPNRSARIALVHYADGDKRYIVAPMGLAVGQTVICSPTADILPGNVLPLKQIPLGTAIHNIELKPGRGGQMVRSAGSVAQLMARDAGWAQVKLPSGEIRKIREICRATIDHPLGGGEGKTSGGRHPCTPWGVREKKTRNNKRTDKYIVRRRG